MKTISVVSGFITNSSSVVHGCDAAIMNDERMQTLLAKYGVEKGFVGDHLFHRGHCTSFVVTEEQMKQVNAEFANSDYGPNVKLETGMVYAIYGDEYVSLASEISALMHEIANEKKLGSYQRDYN